MKKLIAISGLCVLMSAPAFAATYHSAIDLALCEGIFCERDSEDQSQAYIPNGQVSAVPLPAAGWMLLAGVGGLMALRRRARA